MLVSFQDDQAGFGNIYGSGGLVPGFTSQVLTSAKSTTGDVTITLEYFGDFNNGSPSEALTVDIEGVTFGPYIGDQYDGAFGSASPTTVNLTIDQATWATIIADGKINVSYGLGDGFNNISDAPNAEEFIKLGFSWDYNKPSRPPETHFGTDGDDVMPGTNGADRLDTKGGNDRVFAGGGSDFVNGGTGDDTIGGGAGVDDLRGGAGKDLIFGGEGNDSIDGGDGDDVAWGGSGNDLVNGGNGNDLLGGGAGNDAVHGGAGKDVIYGGEGNDRLFGDEGNDALFGGIGRDVLTGGLGNDELSGGAGVDTFIFGKAEGDDVIRDFEGGRDIVDFGGQTYTLTENAAGFAVLELSGGGSILLDGIALADVNADWFLMA